MRPTRAWAFVGCAAEGVNQRFFKLLMRAVFKIDLRQEMLAIVTG